MVKKKRKTGMSKKILIGIGIAVVIIALLVGFYFIQVYKPAIQEKKQLIERFSEFESQYQEKKAQGYDVSEARMFARKAKQAFDKKNYKAANKFLDEAFAALERAKLVIPETVKEEARERLSEVRVASLYERVTDGKLINRSVGDVIRIFKETKTDFIFRGWWIWQPCANSCSEVPPEITYPYGCEEQGYSYDYLEDAISEIKKEIPNVIFCGAIPAQRINFIEINPLTGRIFYKREVEEMALDPSKWGIGVSKEEAQLYFQKAATGPNGYFPDITNPEFQELFLSWAKKQIDCGADAIWIDMLLTQATTLEKITGDPYHPAVKESYEAASEMVDKIHNYGYSKYGKYVYVGSWAPLLELPYTPPDLDFVTMTSTTIEVTQGKLNEEKWDRRIDAIREKFGDIKIFVFFDWAADDTPMAIFSQELMQEEQKDFLGKIDSFLQRKGLDLIYPIHGGFMGYKATRLSYGEFSVYDSLAPEFQTYDTIKNLAQNKRIGG